MRWWHRADIKKTGGNKMEYFQPYIRDFLNWLTEQKVSQNTINGYKQDLSIFIEFMDKQYPETKFNTLTRYHLNRFFEFSKEKSQNTITRRYYTLKKFLSWAYEKELIDNNPGDLINTPPRSEKIPKMLAGS